MFWNYSDFKRYLCKVGFVAALLLGVMNSSVALNKFCRQGQSVRLSLERERRSRSGLVVGPLVHLNDV